MGKHKLIILVGMSPAVITETVYSLWKNNDTPDEVIAITTETGRNEIKSQLIDSGIWKQMLVDLNLPGKIKFGLNSQNIRIIPDHCRENDSCDIVTTDDNNEMADFLLTELRKYTENPEVERISFSIAGGRKSMSAVGALVMTLLGRSNDHLYHVLVNSPYDNPKLEPKFYYPQKGVIHTLGGKVPDPPELQLGEIPFVRCRYWFEEKMRDIPNYSTLVNSINQKRDRIRIEKSDISKLKLFINDQEISLSYLEKALYWMFAERRKNNAKKLYSDSCKGDSLETIFRKFIDDKGFEKPLPGKPGRGKVDQNHLYELQISENLGKTVSGIKSRLKDMFDKGKISLTEETINNVSLTTFSDRGRYGIVSMRPDDIEIV